MYFCSELQTSHYAAITAVSGDASVDCSQCRQGKTRAELARTPAVSEAVSGVKARLPARGMTMHRAAHGASGLTLICRGVPGSVEPPSGADIANVAGPAVWLLKCTVSCEERGARVHQARSAPEDTSVTGVMGIMVVGLPKTSQQLMTAWPVRAARMLVSDRLMLLVAMFIGPGAQVTEAVRPAEGVVEPFLAPRLTLREYGPAFSGRKNARTVPSGRGATRQDTTLPCNHNCMVGFIV